MSTNGVNEDADMAECDGEKVVTMMDVLQEQQEFEEDANAVLGASDDKNCTYSKGYINRQALYACLTCCSDSKEDPTKRAGVCLACSLACHENHDLVELYTKRNFRCDCGNPKFSHPCTYTQNKTQLNDDNYYNQNFSGLYCICHRPYPDPDGIEEEMIQCIICEDWLHASHLDATIPSSEVYAEMICKACMEKNKFLHDYTEYAVNGDVDVVGNDENDKKSVDVGEGDKDTKDVEDNCAVNGSVDVLNDENDRSADVEEGDKHTKDVEDNCAVNGSVDVFNDENDRSADVEEGDKHTKDVEDNCAVNGSVDVFNDENDRSANVGEGDKEIKDAEVKSAVNGVLNDENNGSADVANGDKDITDAEVNCEAKNTSSNDADSKKEKSQNNTDPTEVTDTSRTDNANITVDQIEPMDSTMGIVDGNKSLEIEEKQNTESVTETAATDEFTVDKAVSDGQNSISNTDIEIVKAGGDVLSENDAANIAEVHSKNDTVENDTEDKLVESSSGVPLQTDGVNGNTVGDNIVESVTNSGEVGEGQSPETKTNVSETKVSDIDTNTNEREKETGDEHSDKIPKEQRVTHLVKHEDNLDDCTTAKQDIEMDESSTIEDQSKEHKRKLSTEETEVTSIKKPKLEETKCTRPKSSRRLKGATFWPSHFRQKLCTCNECITMYKDLSVLFLIDPEDTVTAYETLGKERTDGTSSTSSYEKGLKALSSLDRVQQINALTEYNRMRDKLLDFLKSFKDRREVVKEEDIKAFFAGMKPKREPDGVYFCR